jgi:hypothetical protein
LNFVPTPNTVNTTQIEANMKRFNRKIRWMEFFHTKASDEDSTTESDTPTASTPTIFKHVKHNLPPNSHHPPRPLLNFLDSIHDDILHSNLTKIHPNLTKKDKEAIDFLTKAQRNREITAKPNDKSGGSSIFDFQDYHDACHSHLYSTFTAENGQEVPFYRQKVPEDLLRIHYNEIKDTVDEGVRLGYVNPQDAKVMVPPEPKPGRFYGLVKNHVDPEQWPGPVPPIRPIVSASGSNTEGISHFVDEHAKSEVKKLESFIEDTRDHLHIISEENARGPQPAGSIPVTLDISGMYTNVPWGEGQEAFKEALDNRDNQSVPTDFLIQLVMLVLCCNVFVFDSVLFMQLFGVAMGSRVAPTFSCLFMGWLEKKMLHGWFLAGGIFPYLWRRYIDDIIFYWRGTEAELIQFVAYLNNFHPTIKFKCKAGTSLGGERRGSRWEKSWTIMRWSCTSWGRMLWPCSPP